MMAKIKVCEDFTEALGGRYINQGDFSGELFRESILIPKYNESIEKNEKLIIDLDGCYGHPMSFLEESFGGLVRQTQNTNITDVLEIISNEKPALKKVIWTIIDIASFGLLKQENKLKEDEFFGFDKSVLLKDCIIENNPLKISDCNISIIKRR